MQLFNRDGCVDICLKNTDKYVRSAVNDLADDFKRVSTACVRPKIVFEETDGCIVIEENGKNFAEPLADESFSIRTDGGKIRISANGYLGTIWGIYAFSEKFLGVDPLYIFNDLAIVKKDTLEISSEINIEDKPEGFGFRGVFINDEDFLGGWKGGGKLRHVGGEFYALTVPEAVMDKVVETVLRLRLNLVIPATFLNIDNPPEKALADAVAKRGIYISQHHCEPLGVSSFSFDEYCKKHGKKGKFSYAESPLLMEEVWTHYAEKWAEYDNVVWQTGLRGMGDDRPVWQDDLPTEEVLKESGEFISRAYEKEKEIILKATNGKAKHFTSTLWMEGAALVEKGYLEFPRGVITVFADTAPTQLFGDEYDKIARERGEKYGIYYHLQYYGCGPHYVPQTGLEKLWYNMKLAYDKGDDSYFIMNVGNVREFTFELGAYAKAAWNMKTFSNEKYLNEYCSLFGSSGDDVKAAVSDYFASFPELDSKYLEKHLSKYFNYTKKEPPEGISNFVLKEGSIIGYGMQLVGNFRGDLSDTLCGEYYGAVKSVLSRSDEICERFEKIVCELKEPLKTHVLVKWLLSAKTLNCIYKWYVSLYESKKYYDEYKSEEMKTAVFSACDYLKELLKFRKCAEYGEFEKWYQGDVKFNIKYRIMDAYRLIGLTPDSEVLTD